MRIRIRSILALILLGLIGLGLGSIALPDEVAGAPGVYDGDGDDAASLGPIGGDAYFFQEGIFALSSLPALARLETDGLVVDPPLIHAPTPPPRLLSLTRAPPVS